MKITVKTGLIFALLWIAVKLSMYWFGMVDSQIPGTLINILCLLLTISVGLFLSKLRNKEKTSALDDIKSSMTAGLPYTLIVSGFIYFFYANIDADFTNHKISERMALNEKGVNDPKTWATYKKNHSEYETYSPEQYLEEEKLKIEAANNPKSIFIISLLGGLMMGAFYSILVTAIYRKIVFR